MLPIVLRHGRDDQRNDGLSRRLQVRAACGELARRSVQSALSLLGRHLRRPAVSPDVGTPVGSRPAQLLAIAVLALATSPSGADLKPPTLAAFDRYVTLTEARMAGEKSGASLFLWIDRQADGRPALLERLKRGEVVSARLQTRDGKADIAVPDGLIHHWVGTVLLPGATIDRVMAVVKDYPQYPTRFAPLIQRARVLNQSPEHFDVSMRTWAKKVLTVVIDADYGVDYHTLRPASVVSRSVASNIYEVEDAGTPGERRTPADRGQGFLWRLNTYCWFDQRPEGVYEQCESISLTRDVPFGLGWMIKPFITSIPRETIEFTLGKVRAGVS
jgi:hypothetical protein